MDKERMPNLESGFSEEQLDKQANKLNDQNKVVAGNIFDATKKDKVKKD